MRRGTRLAFCVAVVGLGGGGVAVLNTHPLKAQAPPPAPPLAPEAAGHPEPPGPAGVFVPAGRPAFDPAQNPPADLPPEPTEIRPPAPSRVRGDDPLQAADTFIKKTRREAEASVKALRDEAAALRERLKKVESALGRWESLLSALEADQPRRTTRTELSPAPDEPGLVPGSVVTPPAAAPGGQLEPVPSEVRSVPAAPHETL